jgi:N6-L-threonylcarbamoyladenine synthase
VILAIETSCDESATALFDPALGLRGEWVHSQVGLHGRHGGVVPDLAAREHLRHLPPLLGRAFAAQPAGAVARVAVTVGPGLAPCLALGVGAAKAVASALGVPLEGVNHLRAHAWSVFIPVHAHDPGGFGARLRALLPHLALIVSGGHTMLVRIASDRSLEGLSSTRDDAAGEALDKGAKLLGLGYPGGPQVESHGAGGDPGAFAFPRALPGAATLDFSFSGLKTSLRYTIERLGPAEVRRRMPDLCASYQAAVVDALADKARRALSGGGFASAGLSGGVSANSALRSALAAEAARAGIPLLASAPGHTGDNAAMIGFAAWIDGEAPGRPWRDLGIAPSLGLARPQR